MIIWVTHDQYIHVINAEFALFFMLLVAAFHKLDLGKLFEPAIHVVL